MARAIKITSVSGALTITITGPNGGTPTVYADSSFINTQSMPATIADAATTTFWLQGPGKYTLSVKTSGGTEIAADNNSTRTVDLETPGSVAALNYDARTLATIAGDSGHSTAGGSAASSSPLTDRGAWVTSHAYVVNDLVTQSGSKYVCSVAHTSGTFATDLAATDWVLVGGAAAIPAYIATSNPITVPNQKTPAQLTFAPANQSRSLGFGWHDVPSEWRVSEDFFNSGNFSTRYTQAVVSGTGATVTYSQNGKVSAGGANEEFQFRSNTRLIAPHAVVAVKVEPGSTGGVSVGIAKDTTHFLRCYWSLDNGYVGGTQSGLNAGGGSSQTASAFLPAPTTSTGPIWFGCTMSNQYAIPCWSYNGIDWYSLGTGSGTYAAPTTGDNLTTAATMAGYRAMFHLNPSGVSSTTTISGFRVWYPGPHGARDTKLVTYKDGTPYTRDGKYFVTMTISHGGASFYCNSWGVFSVDPHSYRLSPVSRIFQNLSGTGLNSGYAGQIVYDDSASQWIVLGNSWGFDDGTHSGIDETYGTTTKDLTRPGVYVVNTQRLTLGANSYYDGSLRYDSAASLWRVVLSEANARTGWTARNPALYTGSSLTSLTRAAIDTGEVSADGSTWVKIGNTWYAVWGNTTGFKVYDAALASGTVQSTWSSGVGSLGFGTFPAHPCVIPVADDDGTTRYLMATFDNSTEEGGGQLASLGGPIITEASPIVTGWEFDRRKPTGF